MDTITIKTEFSKKVKKQAQHRAATETAARELIDPLLHSLDSFLVVKYVHSIDILCFYKLFSSTMGGNSSFPTSYDRLAQVSKRTTS